MGLFREEVYKSKQERWMGSIQLTTTRMGWPVAILAALTSLAIVLALCFGHFTRSEQVTGRLIPNEGLINVATSLGGRVVDIHVSEGEEVEAGEVLVEVIAEHESRTTGVLGMTTALELERQQRLLRDEIGHLDTHFKHREHRLVQRRRKVERQLEVFEAQLAVRQRQLDNARSLLDRVQPVWQAGQLSALQFQQYESAALDAEARVELAQIERLELVQGIADVDAELEELPHEQSTQRSGLENQLAEINRAMARNDADRSLVLRAPKAGRISGVNAQNGQSVRPGQTLLAIRPRGSELIAELWVTSSSVGLIDVGDPVSLRYQAYPHEQYGQHRGQIIEIAESAFTPSELLESHGLAVDEPVYKVLVHPERQHILARGRPRALRAHLGVEATMILGRQTVAESLGFRSPPVRSGGKRPMVTVSGEGRQ